MVNDRPLYRFNERGCSLAQDSPVVRDRFYGALYEATPAMLHSIDSKGRLIQMTDVWLDRLGYTRKEVEGRLWVDFLAPESRAYATDTVIPELFRSRRSTDIEHKALLKDGSFVDILFSAVVGHDVEGAICTLTVIEDLTERKRAQAELVAQGERLRATLDSIGVGVITTDRIGQIEYLNPIAEKITGWNTSSARGRASDTVFRIIDEATRNPVRNLLDACLAEGPVFGTSDHVVLVARDGREYCVENCAAPIKDATGQSAGVVLVFHDVSEQRRCSQEITYRATHDALTEIINRSEFERQLQLTQDSALGGEGPHAFMYIDLDKFKLANDIGGHAAGDKLLKKVVEIMRRVVRKNDILGRLGGDEFGLLLKSCPPGTAQKVAHKICQELDTFRFQHGEHLLHVGASIGLVVVDSRWSTTANLLQAGDDACYAAKRAGRNRVHTYVMDDEAVEAHRDDIHWAQRLENALHSGGFVLHWQCVRPLINDAGGVYGEILLRMVDDDGSLIPPSAFMPVAERFEMSSRIDRWVVRAVFEWMEKHKTQFSHIDSLAVNLSGFSLGDRDFHRYVQELIDVIEFDHRKICFEITEAAAISNMDDAISFLECMRISGVRFALDDFGSGVSSFSHLKRLPVDFIKIAGRFVRGLCDDQADQATVRCICEIAKITGKKTIAECVETEVVDSLLRNLGVDYAQGFLRHRPAVIDQIIDTPT